MTDVSKGVSTTYTVSGFVRCGHNDNFYSKWLRSGGSTRAPAIASDNTVYVSMSEASVGAFLYGLNPDNTVKWKLDYTNDLNTPALSKDDTVYVGCYDGNLYAINADGSQTWNTALGNGSTSTVTPEGIVYTSTNDGCLYAFNPDGVIQWTYNLNSYPSPPVIGPDGIVYIGDGTSFMGNTINGLHAVDQSGNQKWVFTLTGWTMRDQPAIGADGTIYITGLVFGAGNSALLAFNPDGTLLWVYGSTEIMHSPAIGNDGTLYVGSEDNYLYAFGP